MQAFVIWVNIYLFRFCNKTAQSKKVLYGGSLFKTQNAIYGF